MDALLLLIPVALVLGVLGLGGFLWALKSGQFDDLDGAAHRILFDDEEMTNDNGQERRNGKKGRKRGPGESA